MKTVLVKYLKLTIDILIILASLFRFKLKNLNKSLRIDFENKTDRECYILGNGPSLDEDIEVIIKNSTTSTDIYSVNYFAKTKYFELLKPNYYFLADRLFWSNNILPQLKKENESIFHILKLVNWKLTIICPIEGYDFLKKKLKSNSNLSFIALPHYSSKLLTDYMTQLTIRHRLFSIPHVNSVITLLWFSILMSYKKILLYGCDFSAFRSFDVNQKTNKLIVSPDHFYLNSKAEKNASKKYIGQQDKTIAERFLQVYKAFHYLDILAKISKEMGVKVFNHSSFSYIDSFPRNSNESDIKN